MSDNGIIAAFGAAIGTMVAVMGFVIRYIIDRIAGAKEIAVRAEAKADVAQQEAAEAKNENDNLRESFTDMIRNIEDRNDRTTRATGEGLAAIRQHTQNIELYIRDKFVLKEDFKEGMKEIKDGLSTVGKKLDDLSTHIRSNGATR